MGSFGCEAIRYVTRLTQDMSLFQMAHGFGVWNPR